ncbi:MAG: hypothetical protein HYY20_01085 [Candidatus Tectomicrobia bacterium]|uniref:DUF35 domain-containing protein n=1 Tax=Tectimicrobiota bacterium TaxID=2528274 RepID=A0A932CLD1_UNCTE|nr:hypothetical protein [Candidatus Tectomicrobia bacterium]
MKERVRKPVIPLEMMPEAGMREVTGQDGKSYLLRNDAMFTGVQHAQGEFSEFFLALRDECRILGHRCPECRHLIIPPFMQRCASCNFVQMTKEYVTDTGVLLASPVITIFAPSRFKDQVPFGTGRVCLQTPDGALTDTAMLVRVRTTRGAIRPGIYRKGTPVKLVFAEERRGEILDLFALPQSELTAEQIARSPLMESEIEWERLSEIEFEEPTPAMRQAVQEVIRGFRALAEKIQQSPRARANLAHWRRAVRVRTGGGTFGLILDNERLEVREGDLPNPDLVWTIEDPSILLRWLHDGLKGPGEELESPPLTDLVMEGTLWLDRTELETITRLDRIPRSLQRDRV